jgi:hypothetical protein
MVSGRCYSDLYHRVNGRLSGVVSPHPDSQLSALYDGYITAVKSASLSFAPYVGRYPPAHWWLISAAPWFVSPRPGNEVNAPAWPSAGYRHRVKYWLIRTYYIAWTSHPGVVAAGYITRVKLNCQTYYARLFAIPVAVIPCVSLSPRQILINALCQANLPRQMTS